MNNPQRPMVVEYQSQSKVFIVEVGNVTYQVPSPYQRLEKHFLSELASDIAIQNVRATQQGAEINGKLILRNSPELARAILDEIKNYHNAMIRLMVEEIIFHNGMPGSLRCASDDPPTFNLQVADLSVTLQIPDESNLRVMHAIRLKSGDDAMDLARDVTKSDGKVILDGCIRLWTEKLDFPVTRIFVR